MDALTSPPVNSSITILLHNTLYQLPWVQSVRLTYEKVIKQKPKINLIMYACNERFLLECTDDMQVLAINHYEGPINKKASIKACNKLLPW